MTSLLGISIKIRHNKKTCFGTQNIKQISYHVKEDQEFSMKTMKSGYSPSFQTLRKMIQNKFQNSVENYMEKDKCTLRPVSMVS